MPKSAAARTNPRTKTSPKHVLPRRDGVVEFPAVLGRQGQLNQLAAWLDVPTIKRLGRIVHHDASRPLNEQQGVERERSERELRAFEHHIRSLRDRPFIPGAMIIAMPKGSLGYDGRRRVGVVNLSNGQSGEIIDYQLRLRSAERLSEESGMYENMQHLVQLVELEDYERGLHYAAINSNQKPAKKEQTADVMSMVASRNFEILSPQAKVNAICNFAVAYLREQPLFRNRLRRSGEESRGRPRKGTSRRARITSKPFLKRCINIYTTLKDLGVILPTDSPEDQGRKIGRVVNAAFEGWRQVCPRAFESESSVVWTNTGLDVILRNLPRLLTRLKASKIQGQPFTADQFAKAFSKSKPFCDAEIWLDRAKGLQKYDLLILPGAGQAHSLANQLISDVMAKWPWSMK